MGHSAVLNECLTVESAIGGTEMKKSLSSIVVVCGIAGLFFLYQSLNKKPYQIGYIGSISGKYAAMGTSARNGALLAMEEINKAGGIDGHPLELIVRDDQGLPEKSLDAAVELKQLGLKIIIGPFTTGCATKVLPYINKEKILTIGPATAGENLANQDDYFIKLYPSTKSIGEQVGRLGVTMGIHRMAVISDLRNKRFGETMVDGFRPVFESPDHRVTGVFTYFSSKETAHLSLAEELMKTRPKGVFIIASALDAALFAQYLKKIDNTIQLFSSPWAITPELIQNGGGAVEGLRFYVPSIYRDQQPSYLEFKDRYVERFSEPPTHVSTFNYEAMKLVGQGLQVAGSTDPLSIKKVLLKIGTFTGLQADFSLNASGDAARTLHLHEIRNQRFVPVKS